MNEPHILDPPEIFRGHTDECMRHLAADIAFRSPKGSKEAGKAREPIAKFCRVSINTVRTWFSGETRLPQGETLIRLICYLDMIGYKVIEFENMAKAYRHYCELIAFGIIENFPEAAKLVGYADPWTMSQVLQGKARSNETIAQRMFEVWKTKKAELEIAKEAIRKECCPTFNHQPSATEEQKLTVRRNLPIAIDAQVEGKDAAMCIMEGLLVLLDQIRPHKKVLRQHASVVLRLSAHLQSYCSSLTEDQPMKGEKDDG